MKNNQNIIRTFFLFGIFFCFGQMFALSNLVDVKKFEEIVQRTIPLNDTIKLKKTLMALYDSNDTRKKVLYYGLLANGYSGFFDKVNLKSKEAFANSIKIAKESNDASLIVWSKFNYCKYLYYYRKMDMLTPILLETIDQANKMDADKIILTGETYKVFGWIMFTVGDDELALQFLQKALIYTDKNSQDYGAILNAIGNCYLKDGNIEKATDYFDETVTEALRINDVMRYAKALGDKALIAEKNGNLIEAVNLLKEDIVLSKNLGEEKNYMYASILLAKMLLKQEEFIIAKVFLDSAEQVALTKTYYVESLRQILELKLLIVTTQETDEQHLLKEKLKKIEESLLTTDGSSALLRSKWMLQKTKYNLKIKDAPFFRINDSKTIKIYLVGFSFFVLLSIGLYIFYKK